MCLQRRQHHLAASAKTWAELNEEDLFVNFGPFVLTDGMSRKMHENLLLRLSNREYTNWIKAGQCLCLLAQGLQPFIDTQMRDFHANLLNQNTLLRRPCETFCKPSGNKFSGACRLCSEWQRVIMAHHRQPQNIIYWDNCSPVSWRNNHWEVAKAFMPRGQGKVKEQFDASALLNLICSCNWFYDVDPKSVKEVIRYRNELMHSSDLHMKDEWMKHYDKTLRNLLRQFRGISHMATAEQQINQMLRADLSIQLHGLDQTDLDSDIATDSAHDMFSVDLISQWESELLREKLQEMLSDTDANTSCSGELRHLDDFFEANKDLEERFSSELQNINSLKQSQ